MTNAPELVRAGSWVRVAQRTRRFSAFALLLTVAFVVMPFTAPSGTENSASIFAFCWCVAALGLFIAIRLARAGLWLAADGIVVRNPIRTITVPLNEADGFVAGVAAGSGNGTPCPILKRRNGRSVGIWALGREGFIWGFQRYTREMKPLCEELNAVLRALDSGSAAPAVGARNPSST